MRCSSHSCSPPGAGAQSPRQALETSESAANEVSDVHNMMGGSKPTFCAVSASRRKRVISAAICKKRTSFPAQHTKREAYGTTQTSLRCHWTSWRRGGPASSSSPAQCTQGRANIISRRLLGNDQTSRKQIWDASTSTGRKPKQANEMSTVYCTSDSACASLAERPSLSLRCLASFSRCSASS
jgi:hypothetical protein